MGPLTPCASMCATLGGTGKAEIFVLRRMGDEAIDEHQPVWRNW